MYKKAGWKESDFVHKSHAGSGGSGGRPSSPTNMNSTLNRPMASQSGTRYEDRTMQRGGGASGGGGGGGGHLNNSAAAAAAQYGVRVSTILPF